MIQTLEATGLNVKIHGAMCATKMKANILFLQLSYSIYIYSPA